MLTLLPILILLLGSAVLLAMRFWRPRFGFYWLTATAAALAAFPLVLITRLRLPQFIPLTTWQPLELFPTSPAFLIDFISWPYAVALVGLILAVVLTDVARIPESEWSAWSSSLLVGALGLIAVLAGNLTTLLIGWGLIDLVELIILMAQVRESKLRERVAIAYAARMAGIMLLVWAGLVAQASGFRMNFAVILPEMNIYLLIAAGLRLGVLPLHLPLLDELSLRRGLGTLLRLVPVAASLVLLNRTALAGAPAGLAPFLLGLAALAALYGALAWATSNDELDGRPFWIMSLAGFSVAAAVRGQLAASQAWALALLFSGGLLFLTSARPRPVFWITGLGLLGVLALPFTPAWQGVGLYAAPFTPLLVPFLLAHGLLAAGYLAHALRPGPALPAAERWVALIYPLGLILLPAVHFVVSAWGQIQDWPAILGSWPGLAAIVIAAGLLALDQKGLQPPEGLLDGLRGFFSFGWLYRGLWGVYQFLGRGVAFLNLILEGQGGILWTLLLLTLLLSLLIQRGAGG